MADDVKNEGNEEEEGSDASKEEGDLGALTSGAGGLGNLPPLSDFDSASAADSDIGLPPLGGLDSDVGIDSSSEGGLPPLENIQMATPDSAFTPQDTGSTPATPAFDTPAADTPTAELDTPEPVGGFGFQDLQADSDFSPETPEIGPGPDSDIETPMFDSAFGGESGEVGLPQGGPGGGTPAPTQAMETPLFEQGAGASGGGFDQDAFSGATPTGGGMEDLGTPVPDFSPDTGMPAPAPVPTPAVARTKKRGRMGAMITTIGVGVAAAIIGIVAGPFVADMLSFLPNPTTATIDQLTDDLAVAERALINARGTSSTNDNVNLAEEITKLRADLDAIQASTNTATAELVEVENNLEDRQQDLAKVTGDIDSLSIEYVEALDEFEQLRNSAAITEAQHLGLLAESERLTEEVGRLEVANERRQSTKDTLLHDLDLLLVQIEQGIALTPERYSYTQRLSKARGLRQRVLDASWVDPELLAAYTELYVAELDIASSRQYFFAKIPVHDSLGVEYGRWAECVMNGNWSVYYRTIDGNHVGSYENVSATGSPDYQFREDLPAATKAEIEEQIIASRVEGYEEKIAVLEGKQAITGGTTGPQRVFESL